VFWGARKAAEAAGGDEESDEGGESADEATKDEQEVKREEEDTVHFVEEVLPEDTREATATAAAAGEPISVVL
jgi:hypothetical protein